MDYDKIRQYDRYMPRLSKRAVEALSNELRRAILGRLAVHGPSSFSEISSTFQANRGSLSRHLQKLVMGGLLENYYRRSEEARDFSYYEITTFGANLVKSIARAVTPAPSQETKEFHAVSAYPASMVEDDFEKPKSTRLTA